MAKRQTRGAKLHQAPLDKGPSCANVTKKKISPTQAADMDAWGMGTQQEYEDAMHRKPKHDTQLTCTLGVVGASVVASWLLGAAGSSLAWLLLLLALVGTVWKGSLSRLVANAVAFETLRVRRRRALRQEETAEWLNFLLNRWWIFSSPGIFQWVKNTFEPMLNTVKPAFLESLELRQFTLGDQTPVIKGVKSFDITPAPTSAPAGAAAAAAAAAMAAGLSHGVHHQVALEADVAIHCEDFRAVLRARLGGRSLGVDLDVVMEKLHISGRVYVTLDLNMDAPFPHVARLTLTFVERPEVWFGIGILKAVQMMEVPVLKTWLHSLVLETITNSLVDPGHLDINLAPVCLVPERKASDLQAQGVLTVSLRVNAGPNPDDVRWLVVQMGSQRQVTSTLRGQWQECRSFLVGSLQDDMLLVKVKSKRFLSAVTATQFELPLATLNLAAEKMAEMVLQKKGVKMGCGAIPPIALKMEYTTLNPVHVDQPMPVTFMADGAEKQVAGVMFVCIHSANVSPSEQHFLPNPYCILFNNRTKVKTTHYLCSTSSPKWESTAEFLVSDFTQVSLSFVVCSWDSTKMTDDDFLGLATYTMSASDTTSVRKHLSLSGNTGGTSSSNPVLQPNGTITVSVVFRPVAQVARSNVSGEGLANKKGEDEGTVFPSEGKRNSQNFIQHAQKLFLSRESDPTSNDIVGILADGRGLMEVTVLRAKDLIAKDLNGFSDPYCELRVSGELKYKTGVKKKTLQPIWEESVITSLPRQGETLEVVIWDHDAFGMRDFLGAVTLGLDALRHLSRRDSPEWMELRDTKSGWVELRVKIITEELEEARVTANGEASMHRRDSSVTSRSSSGSYPSPAQRKQAERSRLHLPLQRVPTVPVVAASGGEAAKDATNARSPSPTLSLSNSSGDGPVPNGSPAGRRSPAHLSLPSSEKNLSVAPNPTESPSDGKNSFSFRRAAQEYGSFKAVRQKVKHSLSHPLRRFRSEANVHEESRVKKKPDPPPRSQVTLSIEPRGGGEADATELLREAANSLGHALSQPNLAGGSVGSSPSLHRVGGKGSNGSSGWGASRPEKYYGVEGKVLQAQGLHVSQTNQLYCRVKVHCVSSPEKRTRKDGGKTITKSRLLPAVPNPSFELDFYLDSTDGAHRQTTIIFEILTPRKEVLASSRVTLQELFSDTGSESGEAHRWLSLSNGASLEVEVAHGREGKRGGAGKKLFRSWSVHRIGKI